MNNITYISSISDKKPSIYNSEDIINKIRGVEPNNEFSSSISQIRPLFASDYNKYKQAKSKLPAIMWGGEFSNGHNYANLTKYSNQICLDIDEKDNKWIKDYEVIKQQLQKEEWISNIFISPSGKGVKVIVKFEPSIKIDEWNKQLSDKTITPVKNDWLYKYHTTQYNDLEKYFLEKYNIVLDPTGKDISRLCFICFDENTYIAPNVIPRKVVEIVIPEIISNEEKKEIPTKKEKSNNSSNHLDEENEEESEDKLKKVSLKEWSWRINAIPHNWEGHNLPFNNGYEIWLRVGWALHNRFEGSEDAFNVFCDWSKKSSKFVSIDHCRKIVWDTAVCKRENKITLKTLQWIICRAVEMWYQKNIYNDINQTGEIYSLIISLKTQSYLLKKPSGLYKLGGKSEAQEAIIDYLSENNMPKRQRAIKHILKYLHLISGEYEYISVLPPGIHEIGGEKYLAIRSHNTITPKKGDWKNIKYLIETTMPKQDYEWLYCWIKHALIGYMKRNMTSKGQAIVFIGEGECGKTTISEIITKLLGGIAVSIKDMLGDNKIFNRELMMHPVWNIDDTLNKPSGYTSLSTFHSKMKDLIKYSTVETNLSFETKFKDKVTFPDIYRRMIITLNNSDDKLELFPECEDDIKDKYALLACTHKFTLNDSNGKMFDKQLLWDELPAFAYFILNEMVRPDWLSENGRLGIMNYHNSSITKEIYNSSPTQEILDDIENFLGLEKHIKKISGKTNEIFDELQRIISNNKIDMRNRAFGKISPKYFGKIMGQLSKHNPNVVYKTKRNNQGFQQWEINFDSIREQLLGTEME